MKDPHIEDISCDGSDIPIFVYHRKYHNLKTNISFEGKRLDSFVVKLTQRCNKQISIGEPLVNSTLPDGSRLMPRLEKKLHSEEAHLLSGNSVNMPLRPADLIS